MNADDNKVENIHPELEVEICMVREAFLFCSTFDNALSRSNSMNTIVFLDGRPVSLSTTYLCFRPEI